MGRLYRVLRLKQLSAASEYTTHTACIYTVTFCVGHARSLNMIFYVGHVRSLSAIINIYPGLCSPNIDTFFLRTLS